MNDKQNLATFFSRAGSAGRPGPQQMVQTRGNTNAPQPAAGRDVGRSRVPWFVLNRYGMFASESVRIRAFGRSMGGSNTGAIAVSCGLNRRLGPLEA